MTFKFPHNIFENYYLFRFIYLNRADKYAITTAPIVHQPVHSY